MATDFPNSPSNGDTHAGFTYNSTTGAWESTASAGTEPPVILTEPPTTTQSLNADGTTSTVTMTAQDPDGFDITYGIAYKTAGNTLPSQLASATTIDQSTGIYTFTPSTTTSNAGSFTARLSATDGIGYTTRLVNFDLAFSVLIDYLVVGGGGSGGQRHAGGGGAGGLLYSTNQSITRGVTTSITIGAGGTHPAGTGGVNGGNGGNTVFGSFATAIGGGGGGSSLAGGDGGSGGGGGYSGVTAGSGTSGQGNNGGAGAGGSPYHGGGGGGAGAAGSAAGSNAGNGGNGLEISITGTPTYYAGGGGGGNYYATSGNAGSGGLGGGGAGASGVATNGTDGLGGGGGGSGGTGGVGADGTPGDGGSGVVIIRTLATASATTGSPNLTTDGSYNIYTFTADGSITF